MEKQQDTFWNRVRVWFHDSETIVWARLQMVIGALWLIISTTDLLPIFTLLGWEKYMPAGLILIGFISEYLRRAREPHDLGVKTIADLNTVNLPIKQNDTVTVDKVTGTVTVEKAADIPVDVQTKAEEQK